MFQIFCWVGCTECQMMLRCITPWSRMTSSILSQYSCYINSGDPDANPPSHRKKTYSWPSCTVPWCMNKKNQSITFFYMTYKFKLMMRLVRTMTESIISEVYLKAICPFNCWSKLTLLTWGGAVHWWHCPCQWWVTLQVWVLWRRWQCCCGARWCCQEAPAHPGSCRSCW